ncbi:ATP-grasp domain-containing protein [Streptomyces sp. NBC_00536]|uniref:ATP-grasp domain-containing protein n=1 Tax=Streptomyces sp. NBC_00536 TaxID=2975769 RepID=UPI002E81FAA0|nr:ATP-grasp domain-containing protein [Streptomyces sp. NBC_00536]WUC79584.1 ATP-grasp domain-containing protein [Streptomyces sp. NBC_00536]
MSQNRPVVVLVDAYTSGKYLPPEFTALGADLVHVQSTPEFMPSMPAPDLSVYRAALVHEDLEGTLLRLKEYAPVCVLAGQEPGVLLADQLAEGLGLPANGPALSEARRDKYLMGEALRVAGLHCADQLKSRDTDTLVRWAERTGRFPAVVKPLNSAAGDGVFICADAEEVRTAADGILDTETIYGDTNTEVLVQSYLQGTEYVVDMVSYEGRRHVCGVWEYEKRLLPSGRNIYDRDRLLAADEGPAPELIAYVEEALDALGVRFGPTHAEVILTPQGPALVEVGTRIAGNMHPAFHSAVAGGNQAALTALAYLDPARFLADHAGRRYGKLREAVCHTTSTTQSGTVESIDEGAVAELSALETVDRFDLKIGPGGTVRPTVDLYSSTLRIFMSGASMAEIDRDCRRIDEIKDRIYRFRETSAGAK